MSWVHSLPAACLSHHARALWASTHRNRTLRHEARKFPALISGGPELWLGWRGGGGGIRALPPASRGTPWVLLFPLSNVNTHLLGQLEGLKEIMRGEMHHGLTPELSPRSLNATLWGRHCPPQLFISTRLTLGRGLPTLSLQWGWTSAGIDQGTQISKLN